MSGPSLPAHIFMRRWFYILSLFALALIAARPLFAAQFFYSDDGLDHLFRLFALDRTIQQGVVYPRWIFDLAFGYGYPIFDFYPPLTAYLAETLHLLGLGFADAIKGAFVVCIVVAVTGAFVMGAELFGGAAEGKATGLLTAAAYVFFPYFLIDIYVRGALAEALAASLLPWLIWSVRRSVRAPSISFGLLTGLIAALVLTAHSLTLALTAPGLVVYVLIELSQLSPATRLKTGVGLAASALMGIGLSAIYWLPFAAELGSTQIGNGIDSMAAVFRDHFLAPADLIQSSLLYIYHGAPFPLGLLTVTLGVLALGAAVLAGNRFAQRGTVLFWGAAAVLAAVAMLTPLRDIWLTLSLSTMLQYPWRISILVGLGFSIAISALPLTISKSRWFESLASRFPVRFRPSSDAVRFTMIGAFAAAIVWAGIGNLAPQEIFFPRGEPNIAQLARFEAYTGFVGTTTWGEYLPATVKAQDLLTLRAAKGPEVANTATVQIERWAGTERVLRVSTSQPTTLTLRSFYFPGWQAALDDAPVRAFANSPAGLLAVQVPAGEHSVAISLNDTFAQQAGAAISIACALFFAGLTMYAVRRRENQSVALALVFGASLAVFLVPTAAAIAAPPSALQTNRVAVSPELNLVGLRLGARLENGAWQVSDPSASLHLEVYWFTKQATDDKPFSWRLIDGTGHAVSQSDQLSRYGTGNAAAWVPNEIVEDQFDLPLAPALAPSRYQIQVAYGGDYVTVGAVDLLHSTLPALAPSAIAHLTDAQVGKQIRLVGYDAPQVAAAGARLPLTLYWRAAGNVGNDYTVFAQLLDLNKAVAARPQHDTIPGGGLSPTFLWLPGELVADRHDFDLPRDLQPGLYRLIAGMYEYPGLSRLPVVTAAGREPDDVVLLGEIKVAMNAQNARPAHTVTSSLGPAIQLNGYDLQVESRQVMLKLYWQARAKIGVDYKVFIHIVNSQGQIVAQADALPDQGRYPTRIWNAGEQVLDPYQISTSALPAGHYRIFVGMYSPESGERLPAVDQSGSNLPDRRIEIASFDVAGR